jgi:guanylate kinase
LQQKGNKGSLFIVSAPSGAGKTTLCRALVSSLPDLEFSVSYTTRGRRPGETEGRDYSFVTRQEFEKMAAAGEFLEWAEVHGELYGTSKKRVYEILDSGKDVILDIDTEGASQIRTHTNTGTFIFILPPSLDILKKRLMERMTDSEEKIARRLKQATAEIRTYQEYDYVIMNDILEDALRDFRSIIIAKRLSAQMIDPLWIKQSFFTQEAQ